ncbi:MAG: hypothetical protein K9N48_05045 [Verrucomicrobia bacterium]|nr:hypothetical protein [Verrucomicrobiota bacterium]MCF7707934.1 hypothetical protein [Verrucomicrobiota bacterium]
MSQTSRKVKRTVIIIFLAIGLVMIGYGLTLHIQPVYSENNDKGLATGEPEIIREVSRGGLKRGSNGALEKTYTGKPPAACPT